MKADHSELLTSDLGRRADLRYAVPLPVLGIPTRFETNSRDVHAIVLETFGTWARLHRDAVAGSSPSATVRITVRDGSEGVAGRSPVRHTLPDARRVIAQSAGSIGISDPDRFEAVAQVTGELVADRAHFRDEMLQAITLALLSSYDRHFLHAAAIASGKRAVLLAAPSGAGKSTLAYLAHRAGLQVLSEDRVWIQRSPALRVWGWPLRLNLRKESVAHFPELGRAELQPHGAEKERHVVELRHRNSKAPSFFADDVAVCLLARGTGAPSLERIGAAVVLEALNRDIAPGFDRHPERHLPAMRAIAGEGGWRLRLSSDPHAALPLLHRMLEDTVRG